RHRPRRRIHSLPTRRSSDLLALAAPIGILDEHPEWSARLIAELERRRLPFEKIDHSSHGYDPRDRRRCYAVVVNRTSPSSHRRGDGKSTRLNSSHVSISYGV